MSETSAHLPDFASNLRRLMARSGLTLCDVVERTALDERTVKRILSGRTRPHARTLHKLAVGLQVSADELFQTPPALAHRLFDRQTNPLVAQVVAEESTLFAQWTQSDFDELYSRFGTGGSLAEEGVRTTAERMNRNREVHRQVGVVLETDAADLLAGLVALLYHKVTDVPS